MALEKALDPVHPGEYLKEDCIEEYGLSITEAAQGLQVSRKHLSEIINGHAGISPEMAIKLSFAFGSSAEMWLRLQLKYDLWKAKQKPVTQGVRHFGPAA